MTTSSSRIELGKGREIKLLRFRPKQLGGLVVALLMVTACRKAERRTTRLEGEWGATLQVSATKSTITEPTQVSGIFVFDGHLPVYGSSPDPGTIVGRAYIEINSLTGEGKVVDKPYYSTAKDGDLADEIHARIDSAGKVTIAISPQIFGRSPVLTGELKNNTVTGEWTYFSHSDTLATGTFVMRRIPRSPASDSARIRSRRSARAWDRL